MDFQHRPGGKTGVGGVASASDANRDRRERLRQLALETIDLNKDPYFMKNHLGSYECKLCLTLHNNEGCYLAHTQGKKHQANLAARAAKEAKDAPSQPAPERARVDVKRFVKIGRPGYKVTKQRDPESGQQSLLFQIDLPEIVEGVNPRHRFMSAYEQKIEPPDKRWQYLLFAAEPYETIAFKVPSREVDKDSRKFWTHWNKETKQFFMQFAFKIDMKITPLVSTQQPAVNVQKLPASLPPPPQNMPSFPARVPPPPANIPAPPPSSTSSAIPPSHLPHPSGLPPPPGSVPPMGSIPPPMGAIPPPLSAGNVSIPPGGPMGPNRMLPPGMPPIMPGMPHPPSGMMMPTPPGGMMPPTPMAPRGAPPPPMPPPPPPPQAAR